MLRIALFQSIIWLFASNGSKVRLCYLLPDRGCSPATRGVSDQVISSRSTQPMASAGMLGWYVVTSQPIHRRWGGSDVRRVQFQT